MKKTINKKAFVSKPVAAAVGLAMGALVAANAQAVSISNDGIGEVLMFPYYTVNNSYDTNINITNTSGDTVAFKIRFRESENSRDARDFNVILSPYDVWNGTVTLDDATGAAKIVTRDTSCTVGQLKPAADGSRYIEFTNFDYTGDANEDFGDDSLARTAEGHIEVISMGRIPAGAESDSSYNGLTATTNVAYNAKHVNSEPRNCANVRAAFLPANIDDTKLQFVAPLNALKGSASFINAASGKAITSEPTVLADFYLGETSSAINTLPENVWGDNLIVTPETQAPGLHDVQPAVAQMIIDDQLITFDNSGAAANAGIDAVSALFMRDTIVNQYSVNPAVNGQTDWVITFPTKHYYVDERDPLSNVAPGERTRYPTHRALSGAVAPFNFTFQEDEDACSNVNVTFDFYDREENENQVVSEAGFSPSAPAQADSICKEVQVVTFNQTNLFGSAHSKSVDVNAAGFNSGWMQMNLNGSAGLSDDGANVTFTKGFPVIGFSATTLENGAAGDFMLNYGFSANHGFERTYTDRKSVV